MGNNRDLAINGDICELLKQCAEFTVIGSPV